ncbi:DUF5615 family PIN-like protein [Desulfofundulus sp.]|uniref:DUF5615 family PIN-like protein n=1 Tax=Desulfofundulus sp. TaxID=2282750 RepID=UPI003C754A5B
MRFLLNENISNAVARALRESGYEAVMVRDYLGKGVSDAAILKKAVEEGWIVVTCDTDFGDLVFNQGKPHVGVVLLRLKEQRPENQVKVLEKALQNGSIQVGKFISLKD